MNGCLYQKKKHPECSFPWETSHWTSRLNCKTSCLQPSSEMWCHTSEQGGFFIQQPACRYLSCLSNIVGSWISKTSLDNELTSKHKETSICILLPFLELIGSLMRFCFFVLKNIHPTQGIMLLWQNCNYWAVRNCLEVAVRGYATKYEYWVF